MRVGVVFSGLDLHFPSIKHTVSIRIVDQRIGFVLERSWNKQNFVAIDQTIVIRIRIVCMRDEVICAGDNLLSILESIVVGVKHTCRGEVLFTVENVTEHSLLLVTFTVTICINVGGVGSLTIAG